MFFPLIPGFVAVLIGFSAAPPPVVPVRLEIAQPAEAAKPAAEKPVPVVAKPAPVTVIEATRISLGTLRREALRYDLGLAERFIDSATERPPLFE